MDGYMNKGVKEVINEFPQIGTILSDCGIGCVTCSVGTCLLKDIITIHGLSKAQERVVMAKIYKVLDPDADIDIQEAEAADAETPAPQAIKYSPPIKRLVEEHDRIKRLLAFIPYVVSKIDQEEEMNKETIKNCAFFIQNYADKYHHAKEEDILFKYTDERQDIIQVMYEDHKTGRNYVQLVLAGLDAGRKEDVINGLERYRELLTQHIKKEDDILYPWIDRTLTTKQVGEMLSSFNEADRNFHVPDVTEKFEDFLNSLETNYKEELK